ncbi:type II toxin-antitoxin system VapC family toxin [Algoriphagus aestuariicola]|uniref:Type II toxin-antitoxin system VapC family toxin n=1 Tax=Algoriphagus aestuariicola TaxID=1852016 RepID=A0ABS3BLF9_9BACT|nr:type II toxin-antitoxin system VapC family toxin [Algoriphagus aestuariicola]MBN7800143.1 type II toxin-antitoxin system VapC family toxin [Algoriphagus aestuariicola]
MKKVLLDTSLILHYMRGDATFRKIEEEHHLLTDAGSIILLSAISIGEIEGFFLRKNYGEKQTQRWRKLLEKSIILSIDGRDEKLMKAYAAIQAYCQNNHPHLNAGKSQIIGQNDIWIAATASVVNATLFTKDNDFVHLKESFIELVKID